MKHSSIKSNELKLSPNELKYLATLIKTGETENEAENETKLAMLKYLIMLQKELLITTKNTKPLNTFWGLCKHELKKLKERRVSFLTEKIVVPVIAIGICFLIAAVSTATVGSPMIAIATAACIGIIGLGLYKIVPIISKKIFQCVKKGCKGSKKLAKTFTQSLECKDIMGEETDHHFEVKKLHTKKALPTKKLYDNLYTNVLELKIHEDASGPKTENEKEISKLFLEFAKHHKFIKNRIGKYGVTHSKTDSSVRQALENLDLNINSLNKHNILPTNLTNNDPATLTNNVTAGDHQLKRANSLPTKLNLNDLDPNFSKGKFSKEFLKSEANENHRLTLRTSALSSQNEECISF